MLRAIVFSTGYALFVVFFPWEVISRAGFTDFYNYVDYFDFAAGGVSKIERYQLSTLKEYFFGEVLWDALILQLAGITGEARIALRIVSFFILFVWGYFLFTRAQFGVALLFLLHPVAIDVAMSGIRNGLAWSLVIIALSLRSKIARATLFVIGSFIHSATLVLFILYYFTQLTLRVLKGRTVLISGIGVGVIAGLALTIGSKIVLEALGDRRAGEEYLVGGGSVMQASIWGILVFLQCTSGREYIRRNIFVIAILAWYLTMNPFIPWSFRVWGSLLPVIALSVMNLPPQKRQLFMYLYSGYLVLWYLYWTKLFEYWYPA